MRTRLAVLGLLVAPAWADDVATLEPVIAAQKDKVGAILLQQQRGLEDGCGALAVLMPSAVSVFVPPSKQGEALAQGHWQVRYAVDACGEAKLRNVDMKVVNGQVALEPLAPGDSLADAALQADVRRSFSMAGQVAMPQCAEAAVIREATVRAYPKTPTDRWQELWIGRMCGRDVGQVVEFLPTKGGTTFKMSLPTATAAE